MSLENRFAVVTGASGGIGAAIARALAERGTRVLIHYRSNHAGAEATAKSCRERGANCETFAADLETHEGQNRLIEAALAEERTPDIWINNAGADVLTGEAAQWSFERKFETIWKVDVVATMRLSRAIGAAMIQAASSDESPRDRTIITIGWDQAERGMAGDSGEMFAASKGAIAAFSKSLAQSLAPHVRVNCIAPGWIQTAWGHHASSAWQERAQRESLMHRWGTQDDIASAAAFFASPQASFINGCILPVSGGFRFGHETKRDP